MTGTGLEAVTVFGLMGGRMDFNQFVMLVEFMDVRDPMLTLALLNVMTNKLPRFG